MYNWKIDDLQRMAKKYSKKARMASDKSLQLEYESTVNNILDVIDYYYDMVNTGEQSLSNGSNVIVKENFRDIIRDDINKIRTYPTYMPLIKNFRDTMDGTNVTQEDNLHVIKTSQNGIVTLTADFYHQFKGVFSDTFDTLLPTFRNRLYFRRPSKDEIYGGQTYSIYGTNEVFIETVKANTVQDYVSLIHESSHGITCKLNPNIMWDPNKYFLQEVDSLFFEMIGTNYAAKINDLEDDGIKTKIATFKDHLYSAEIICSKMEVYDALSPRELRSKQNIANYYMNEIGYNEELTNDAMYSRIQEYMHYIVSYLIAIELYLVFLKDQEKALDLLYKIIMLKDLNNSYYLETVIKLGINPGENAKEYYELLLKEEEGLKDGKKLQYRY